MSMVETTESTFVPLVLLEISFYLQNIFRARGVRLGAGEKFKMKLNVCLSASTLNSSSFTFTSRATRNAIMNLSTRLTAHSLKPNALHNYATLRHLSGFQGPDKRGMGKEGGGKGDGGTHRSHKG